LTRLITKYGGALTLQPHSIYFLIPPLCPKETAIHRQFGHSSNGLVCSGFTNKDWDDCVATISFENATAAAVTCDDRHIVVGFELGNIDLYSHGSYQRGQTMRHISPIERIFIDPSGAFIVSASIKYLAVLDLDGNTVWQQRLRSRCILLTASSSSVICVMMSGQAIWWDIATGEQLEHHHYPYQPPEALDRSYMGSIRAPFTGSFGPNLELLALVYQTGPICIYELQTHEWITWVVDEKSRNVTHLVFNPNPDVSLLLVAYDDSHLSLYEPWTGALVHAQDPDTNAVLQSLSCSPDGRTFATVDARGNLRIWDFETLTVLYHVLTPTSSNRMLSFTSDGFNLIDVVDREMRIWAPSALIRKTIEEESSVSDQASIPPVIAGQYECFRSVKLRTVISHQEIPVLVTGNHNGDIMVYDQDGSHTGLLYSHGNSVVKCLALSKSHSIASGDTNGIMQVWQLNTSQSPIISTVKLGFQVKFKVAIRQILFDGEGEYLLVSTTDSDYVYEVATGATVGSLSFGAGERRIWRWFYLPAPVTAGTFALVSDGRVAFHSIMTFPTEIVECHIQLDLKVDDGFTATMVGSITVSPETSSLILDVHQHRGYDPSSTLLIFQIPELFNPRPVKLNAHPVRVLSSKYYMHFIGIDPKENRLIFLHKNSWVCSIKLLTPTEEHYTRHFFVPNELTTRARDIQPLYTKSKAFVFALHDKLAVIKNGLVFQEIVPQDAP
jgi:WD40 repeat protein